jgi:hypothetical protein
MFVRRVTVNITKLATPAPDALRVALVKQRRLLALRHQIVFVAPTVALKTFVPVPMALQQRAQHVLQTVPIFVRRVTVNITKLATPAPDALRVALVKQKRLLALRHQIVFVAPTGAPPRTPQPPTGARVERESATTRVHLSDVFGVMPIIMPNV